MPSGSVENDNKLALFIGKVAQLVSGLRVDMDGFSRFQTVNLGTDGDLRLPGSHKRTPLPDACIPPFYAFHKALKPLRADLYLLLF